MIIYGFLLLLGFCLGSFVNALVWRIKKQSQKKTKKSNDKYSIVHGRSMCSHCEHPLSGWDLVPVFSWLWLRGRCRYCRKPIPDTPLPELVMPLLLVVSYDAWPALFGQPTELLGGLLFAVWVLVLVCFVALALYDARWFLLPDRVVWPLTALAGLFVVLRIAMEGDVMVGLWAMLGVASVAGLFWAIELASKGKWIGHGDVKLGISLGLLAGSPILGFLLVFIASLLGMMYVLVVGLSNKARAEKASIMHTVVPFGPFLLAAAVVVVLWGQLVIDWYINLLFVL